MTTLPAGTYTIGQNISDTDASIIISVPVGILLGVNRHDMSIEAIKTAGHLSITSGTHANDMNLVREFPFPLEYKKTTTSFYICSKDGFFLDIDLTKASIDPYESEIF